MTSRLAEAEVWRNSFVDWSQSDMGFYVDQYYDEKAQDWIKGKRPVVWPEKQRRVLEWALTRGPDSKLPVSALWWVDVKKSGKSLIQAAILQWFGQFWDHQAELLMLSNSKTQVEMRCYQALTNSLNWNPRGNAIADIEKQYITFRNTNNVLRPIPMRASTQAGANAICIGIDEIHSFIREEHERLMAEMQSSPTLSTSFLIVTTYPSHLEDDGPLNKVLDKHRDPQGGFKEGVEPVPGLEDLPLSVDWATGAALWWNHAPYPWHERAERGVRYLDARRADPALTANQYLRTWEARRVSREDTLMPMAQWDACTDIDLEPLGSMDRAVPMVIGMDIGIRRDSSACIARGYDPISQRFPLLAHRIWTPDQFKGRELDILTAVEQWILDMHRKHRILAVYYDRTEAQYMVLNLRKAGVRMVELSQNSGRDVADPEYQAHIIARRLRNYPQSTDLREHVRRAVGRETETGIRIVKRKATGHIDAAVADAMACYGASQMRARFEAFTRSGADAPAIRNHFRDIYSPKGSVSYDRP